MNEFLIRAHYIFKRAELMIGKCNFLLFPGNLIAVGKVYSFKPATNDNEEFPNG